MSKKNLNIYYNFFLSNKHILEKGDKNWPVDRILYQLCYEHAEDSTVTKQAEKYFNAGRIAYPHFKNIDRTKNFKLNPNFMTMSGHTGWVSGVHLLEDDKALSWSGDGTLRLCDLKCGFSEVFLSLLLWKFLED